MSLTVDINKKVGDFSLDVSFETDVGVSGLLGPSGSGKSMTLMCIAGIVKPDSGRIILNGTTLYDSEQGINLKPQQRRVGYLFQNYALFPNMTVRQNILCGLHSEKDKAKKKEALENIVQLMQLTGYEKRQPSQLSGGQQQRVALARILIGNPELLLLDEPFSALDSNLRERLQLDTKKLLKRFDKNTLFVTHNRDEAYKLCNKIALLDSGQVIAYKDAKQLFSDPESRQTAFHTGCKNIVDAKKTSDYEVEVPDWGLRLVTAQLVRDDLCAIGIRAHYFDPESPYNRFKVHFIEDVEGPFEDDVYFRYENQVKDSQDVWWRVPKENRIERTAPVLGIAPESIMLLYG